LAEGFQNRYFEFQAFERKLEECISKSAVRTKFEHHSQRGKDIVSEIQKIVDSTYDQAQQLKTQKKEIYDKLNFTERQLLHLKEEMKDKIRQMVEDVKQMVSCFRGTSVACTEGTW
jgi:mitofusin